MASSLNRSCVPAPAFSRKRLHICYLADAGSIHTHAWATWFADRGHQVSVITFHPGQIPDIPVYVMAMPIMHSKLRYLLLAPVVRRLVHQLSPDVLHAHYATGYGFVGALTCHHPYVITCHGSDILVTPVRNLLVRGLLVYGLRRADLVNPVSQAMVEVITTELGVMPVRTEVFQYGLDLSRYRSKEWVPTSESQVVSTRSHESIYRIDFLLRAAPHALAVRPTTRFVIWGEGSQSEHLRTLARRLGINGSVVFPGRMHHPELLQELRPGDIYVSCCLNDGTSLSLLEALASGLFPIVVDDPSNRPWIEHGVNGFLFPPSDATNLAALILQALEDPALRWHAAAINWELVQQRADRDVNLGRMEQRYYELLATV